MSSTLEEAVRLFNAGRYLDAHEAFETLWESTHGESADVYKGLLQASVALHHFREGNLPGASKLYGGHRRYLGAHLPRALGLDLVRFLADMQAFLRPVLRAEPAERVEFDEERRPRLHSASPPPP